MNIEFMFIGWMKEDNHDKVWVAFNCEGAHYCAWGRRDAKLQFKRHYIPRQLSKIIEQKQHKGYKEVDKFLLFSVFPDFEDKVQEELFMKTLSGGVR